MSRRSTFAASLIATTTLIPVATAAPKPGLALVAKHPLVVKGMRFHAGERVTVTAMTAIGPRVARITAGGAGSFKLVFRLPDQPCAAAYVVRARGATGTVATMSVPAAPCVPPPID